MEAQIVWYLNPQKMEIAEPKRQGPWISLAERFEESIWLLQLLEGRSKGYINKNKHFPINPQLFYPFMFFFLFWAPV